MNEEKHSDHEPEMIRSQLKTAERASKSIKKHTRKKENFKAWVQSKITKASDYLDTAADYLDSKEKEVNEEGLRSWFGKSRSKGGKPGWVQVVSGKPCARQPGQKSTPKCVSSAKRASMTDAERKSAQRRKRAADPNQAEKTGAAKPTYVSTDKPKKKMSEEMKRDEYGDPIGGPKISKKEMKKNLMKNVPDEQHTTTTSEEYIDLPLHVEIPKDDARFRLGLMFRESLEVDKGMLFIFEEVGQHSFHMKNTRIPLDVAFVKEDGTIESIKELDPYTTLPVFSDGEVLFAIEANRGWFAENNVEVGDEIVLSEVKDKKGKGSGSKDACYHKVKSRYSVWPSAYASGALVKCRKVGAANWGNSRKESVDINNSDGQLIADVTDIVGPNDLKPVTNENGQWVGTKQITEAKKCWPGYEKKGTKIMFGKRYNNCVKKEDYSNWREELNVTEASAAWQRKEGKNKAGGLNEKGRKSYERQNPGSDLKAPSKKVGNPRRASFCARMKGMKKKLTSSKTANDPDSRINKSLRKWNC